MDLRETHRWVWSEIALQWEYAPYRMDWAGEWHRSGPALYVQRPDYRLSPTLDPISLTVLDGLYQYDRIHLAPA